jgi:hypothetical protein
MLNATAHRLLNLNIIIVSDVILEGPHLLNNEMDIIDSEFAF